MVKGEYKKVLFEMFEVLGFSENEKEMALEGFKKKFANEMLVKLQTVLSEDQRNWIAQTISKKEYDRDDPRIREIQQTINLALEKEELDKLNRQVFKRILAGYVSFMSQKIDPGKASEIQKIAEAF